jgi:serine/threonine protein kinase
MDGGYRMTPTVVAKIARDVLGALEFLHDHLQVVHRDVKPGNILLNREGQAKLADLGIVTYPGQVQIEAATSVSTATVNSVAASETPAETPAIEWIGTMTYMSPERLTGDTYSYSADIWSLGIVIVEAAVGRYPLSDLTLSSGKLEFWDLLDLVRNGDCPANVLCDMGSEWESLQVFAAACLAKSHTQRPRARQLLDASFPGILAGDGDFFLDLATVAGQAALAEWVEMSLSRGGEGLQDSPQIADAQGINSKCAGLMSAEEMHVDECLEADGWL